MHNLRVTSFFLTKNTSAPRGDTLGIIYFYPIIPIATFLALLIQAHSFYKGF